MKTFVFFLLVVLAIYQVACFGDNKQCRANRKSHPNGKYVCEFGCAANRGGFRESPDGFPGYPVLGTLLLQSGLSTLPMSANKLRQYTDEVQLSRKWQDSDYFQYQDNSDLLKDAPDSIDVCSFNRLAYQDEGCPLYNPTIYRIAPGNVFSAGNNFGDEGQAKSNPRWFKFWTEQKVQDLEEFGWALVTIGDPTNEGEFCQAYQNEYFTPEFYAPTSCEEREIEGCEQQYCDYNQFQPSAEFRGQRKDDCICNDGVWADGAITYLVVGYTQPENACDRDAPKREVAQVAQAAEDSVDSTPCFVEKGDVKFHFAWNKLGKHQIFGCEEE